MTGTMTSLKIIVLLRVTRVTSKDVTFMVALLMILFSLFGKVGAFLALVSFPIVVA